MSQDTKVDEMASLGSSIPPVDKDLASREGSSSRDMDDQDIAVINCLKVREPTVAKDLKEFLSYLKTSQSKDRLATRCL